MHRQYFRQDHRGNPFSVHMILQAKRKISRASPFKTSVYKALEGSSLKKTTQVVACDRSSQAKPSQAGCGQCHDKLSWEVLIYLEKYLSGGAVHTSCEIHTTALASFKV